MVLNKMHNIIKGNNMFEKKRGLKTPSFTAKDLQDDLMKSGRNISMLNIRRTQDKHDLHVGRTCQIPLLTKNNIKGQLECAEIHLDRNVEF